MMKGTTEERIAAMGVLVEALDAAGDFELGREIKEVCACMRRGGSRSFDYALAWLAMVNIELMKRQDRSRGGLD
jgi:hypothetical protein